jgi:eukaryotic-like serine/threonine-protein kinase
MVRDDFSMALLRFMRELGIKLVEGQNFDAVDLFDPQHALRVLTAFGRAYGVFSEDPEEISREQKQFLDSAVTGLAQDGRVIRNPEILCVPLSRVVSIGQDRSHLGITPGA